MKGLEMGIEIIVNGKKHVVSGGRMSYEVITALAYDLDPTDVEFLVTVTFAHAEGDKQGSLLPGQCVDVTDGTVFNVVDTSGA